MEFLALEFYGNTAQTWLVGLGIFALTVIFFQVLKKVLRKRVVTLIRKSSTKIDDFFLPVLQQTRLLFLIVIGIYVGSSVLSLSDADQLILNRLLRMAIFLQFGFWGMGLITFYVQRGVTGRLDEDDGEVATTIDVFGLIAKIALWIVVGLLILDNLEVEVNSLIASLGIGGIAVALAVQNVLGDLFASLSIAMDKPFVIGDLIEVDGYAGSVEDIGLKSTRLRSLSGEELVFSNADLLNSRIRNYKRLEERRNVFTFGVSYDTPHETLKKIPRMVEAMISPLEKVRFDRCHLKEMGEFTLNYETVYFVEDPEYKYFMDVQEKIYLDLSERFNEENISMPYPTQKVLLEQGSEG